MKISYRFSTLAKITLALILLSSCQPNIRTPDPTLNVENLTPTSEVIATSLPTSIPVVQIQMPQLETITDISNMVGNEYIPLWSPDGSKIVFVGENRQSLDDSYGKNIYLMNADGNQQMMITESAPKTDYNYPSWSPDGLSIIYVQGNRSKWTINTMLTDGGQKTEIIVCEFRCTNPNWSPDGSNIIYFERTATYYEQEDGQFSIIKYNISSQQKEVVYHSENFIDHGGSFSLTYSPDGKNILFHTSGEMQTQDGSTSYDETIYITDSSGGNLRKIINGDSPSWNPDGTKIIFGMQDSYAHNIYISNPDGTELTKYIIYEDQHVGQPAWSPNGDKVLFVSSSPTAAEDNTSQDIFLVKTHFVDVFSQSTDIPYNLIQHPETCPPSSRFIAELDASSQEIIWSPDMSQIAFVSSFDGDNDIYIMNSNGKDIRKITDNTYDDVNITWLQDSTHLLFATNKNSTFDLNSIEVNGSNQNVVNLLATSIQIYDYKLSPDGKSIIYTGYDNQSLTYQSIYSVDIDGNNKIELTHLEYGSSSPHWSPDGNTIYFENKVLIPRLTRNSYWGDSNSMFAPQIMSMNRDGSGIKTLTNSGAVDSILRISPDGQYIMFRSDRDKPDEFKTYIMNTNGENQAAIVNEQASWWPYFNIIVVFPDDPTIQPYFIDLNGNYLSELPEILKNGYRFLPDKKHVYVYGDNGETFSLCVASIPLNLIP